MEMHYELLSGMPDERDTNASMAGLIKSMAGGALPHQAGALKFGLRGGFSRANPTPPEPVPDPLPPPASIWGSAKTSRVKPR